ncbi:MAG: ion transporter [Bacteroidaceae bacterium]|nr:ion transporter [Bacteroidaceae bacterium]
MEWRKFIHRIIEPAHNKEDRLSRIYDWVMLGAIVMGIVPLMFKERHIVLFYFDIISGVLFIIDYLLRWMTADIHLGRGWRSFIRYPFTFMAIIDLLSILPLLNMLGKTFKIVRISRLLRILRVLKVVRYFESLEIILTVIRKQRRVLFTVMSLSLFYTFITALIMFNAENEISPLTGQPLFRNFFDAFYWACCTLTTVGYGDIYPISDVGRVISILSSMVGIAIIALPSGVITAGYMSELEHRKEQKALQA